MAALKRYPLRDILLISRNESLISLAKLLSIECIQPPSPQGVDKKNLLSYRKDLDQFADSIVGEELFFAFNVAAIYDLYTISRLSMKTTVFYHSEDPRIEAPNLREIFSDQEGRRRYMAKRTIRRIFGMRPRVGRTLSSRYSLFIPDDELKEDYSSPPEVDDELFEQNINAINDVVGIKEVDILFIDNSVIFDQNKVRLLGEKLVEISRKGVSVAVKPHPSHQLPPSFNELPGLNKEIPAEIASFGAKVVIGISSMSLLAIRKSHDQVYSLLPFFEDDGTPLLELVEGLKLVEKLDDLDKITDPKSLR